MLRPLYIIAFSFLLLPILLGAGYGEAGYAKQLPPVPVKSAPVVLSPLDTIDVPPSDIIVQFEGCTDSMVLPPHPSRPTISCGIDLGAIGTKNVRLIFTGIVSDSILNIFLTASRFKTPPSKGWITRNQVHIGEATSAKAFRRALALVWSNTTRGELDSLPDHVRSAILSYSYHTGHLPATRSKLRAMSSAEMSALLQHKGAIYVGSNSKAIRRRRSQEARYIERMDRSTTVAVCRAPIRIPKT